MKINKEQLKKSSLKYRLKNKEKLYAKAKEWRKNNPEKVKALKVRWYKNNKERYKHYELKKKFNISIDYYNLLLKKQNNVCAICGGTDTKNLAVDHDHKTGKVRGLLCHRCNLGLGCFNDDIELIKLSIKYLRSYAYTTTKRNS